MLYYFYYLIRQKDALPLWEITVDAPRKAYNFQTPPACYDYFTVRFSYGLF